MTDPELANDLRQLPLFEALWHYIEKTSHGGVAYEQLRQRYRAWDIRRLNSHLEYISRKPYFITDENGEKKEINPRG